MSYAETFYHDFPEYAPERSDLLGCNPEWLMPKYVWEYFGWLIDKEEFAHFMSGVCQQLDRLRVRGHSRYLKGRDLVFDWYPDICGKIYDKYGIPGQTTVGRMLPWTSELKWLVEKWEKDHPEVMEEHRKVVSKERLAFLSQKMPWKYGKSTSARCLARS